MYFSLSFKFLNGGTTFRNFFSKSKFFPVTLDIEKIGVMLRKKKKNSYHYRKQYQRGTGEDMQNSLVLLSVIQFEFLR